MPPKRKAKTGAGSKAGKKIKKEEEAAPVDTVAKLREADKGRKKVFKVDSYFPVPGAVVHKDYDCMLNQTNIGHNNNKYYVIQVLTSSPGCYYAWNRWGRVGEKGANSLKGPVSEEDAVSDFKKKFKDKTKNDWDKRDNFQPKPGKYVLLEMDGEDEEEVSPDVVDSAPTPSKKKVLACKLDKTTQGLIKLIFDHDMFKEAMQNFEIDVKKMPLGKLSKSQIAKGFEVLEEIEKVLKSGKNTSKLQELSSKFYTLIPHDFGRQRPPTIQTAETVRQKMDMLLVLADIELAQSMEKSAEKSTVEKDEVPHPLDVNYGLLNCGLELMTKKEKEYQAIEKYFEATKAGGYCTLELEDVWKVNRMDEGDRFQVHDALDNRKLLWHGTNVAVVAAILKSGLRIMPHSGGRVGQGIYFASENMKSAAYVRPAGSGKSRTGIMFLNEVALGNEHHITRDDSSLKKPPAGYDSIIAKGRTEPDPKKDTAIKIDGKTITVPQGKPVQQNKFNSSSFSQSEYLIYKESQCRIRYLLKFKFNYSW